MTLRKIVCSKTRCISVALAVVCLALVAAPSQAENRFTDASTAVITLTDQSQLRDLVARRIDIDKVVGLDVTAYLLPSEFQSLQAAGYDVRWIPNLAKIYADSLWEATRNTDDPLRSYHTYEELRNELLQIASDHPTLCHVDSIGSSTQGRGLWFMKISDNVEVEEAEPEFKYIAAMHGDEVVGKEMCMYLINYLVDNYGVLPRVTDLVDNTEIWIMPSMNPDGTAAHTRYNAQGYDLNRNFPDRIDDSTNTAAGRPTEVQVVLNWAAEHSSILSANLHGGALVANYPWDGNYSGSSVYTACPEDALYIHLALSYSTHNLPMYNGSFPQGITNGADWYVIYGGMQDWNFVWVGDRELTLEISNIKWPDQSTLPGYWDDNRESMLSYMEEIHHGIEGVVTDAETGDPIAASVRLGDIIYPTYTDPDVGDYHRVLLPDTYDLTFTASGYAQVTETDIVVTSGDPTVVDVQMTPLDVVFVDDFSMDMGWTGYGGAGEWTRGNPLGGAGDDTHGGPDPTQDHTPGADNNVVGNDLTASDGDYEANLTQTHWLASLVIDCSNFQSTQLEFWQWLGVERNQYDHAYIQAFNGTSWVTVWENNASTADGGSWNQQVIDVSSAGDGNPDFRIRFGIGATDNGWQFCGWNLDDVTVLGIQLGLPVVEDVIASRVGDSSIRLTWSQVPGATHYRIYRGETADFVVGPGSLLIEIADPMTTYVDSDVTDVYPSAFYKITARD